MTDYSAIDIASARASVTISRAALEALVEAAGYYVADAPNTADTDLTQVALRVAGETLA